jgi:hypothetical protein
MLESSIPDVDARDRQLLSIPLPHWLGGVISFASHS